MYVEPVDRGVHSRPNGVARFRSCSKFAGTPCECLNVRFESAMLPAA